MMRHILIAALAGASVLGISSAAKSASLRVSPILIDAGSASNTSITLLNNEARPMAAQVRVFRWSQHDGQEELVPTDDVVASPPIVTIGPREEYVVRLQRAVGTEPTGEEAYRVVVDELPNPNRQRNGTVAVVLRYVVPAFFYSPDASQPRIKWSVGSRDGLPVIVAQNSGDKRIQLNNLALKTGSRSSMLAKGLAGYVLGHASKEWPLGRIGSAAGGTIVAMSDNGAIRAPVSR